MNPTTIFACEKQPIVIVGLTCVLEGIGDLRLCGHAADLNVALQQAAAAGSDVFLLGQPPNAKSVLPLLDRAVQAQMRAQIVVWASEMSDMDAFRALQMGARGVITRTQPVNCLIECLRAVAGGEVWLRSVNGEKTSRTPSLLRITPRERQILELVCEGLRNREIAERISITPGTVKVHLMHIFEKTGVKDRFQLALQGRQLLAAVPQPDGAQKETASVDRGAPEPRLEAGDCA